MKEEIEDIEEDEEDEEEEDKKEGEGKEEGEGEKHYQTKRWSRHGEGVGAFALSLLLFIQI